MLVSEAVVEIGLICMGGWHGMVFGVVNQQGNGLGHCDR